MYGYIHLYITRYLQVRWAKSAGYCSLVLLVSPDFPGVSPAADIDVPRPGRLGPRMNHWNVLAWPWLVCFSQDHVSFVH
jgi:hypothetical protein